MLIHDPDSAPGPGGRVRAEPMGRLQWLGQEACTLVLSCRACLALSGLVFQGCLCCLLPREMESQTTRPRPELLFDAPSLTGHAPARPGNPSDILQELARACKRRKTSETRQSSPAHLGRRPGRQSGQLDGDSPTVGEWAGGRWIAVLPIDHQSPGKTAPNQP